MTARRDNAGKIRHDLLHPRATRDMAEVFTFGAAKYGDYNWQRGMEWTKMIASAKRHLNAIESGIDYDDESGLLHVAHLAANIHMLNAYYYIHPQGDNRTRRGPPLRIGLDIDEVLADFNSAWTARNHTFPNNWDAEFDQMRKDGVLDSFYLSLQPLIFPTELQFHPACYITARPVSSQISAEWLAAHGFPPAPVYTTTHHHPPTPALPAPAAHTKAFYAKEAKLDIFIDDNWENCLQIEREAGVFCYLFDRPHNSHIKCGHRRLNRARLADLGI